MYCILELKLIILLIAYIYYTAKLKTVNLKLNAHTVNTIRHVLFASRRVKIDRFPDLWNLLFYLPNLKWPI